MNNLYVAFLVFRITMSKISAVSNNLFFMFPSIAGNNTILLSIFGSNMTISSSFGIVAMIISIIYHRIIIRRVLRQVSEFLAVTEESAENQGFDDDSDDPESDRGSVSGQRHHQDHQLREIARRLNPNDLDLAIRFIMGGLGNKETKIEIVGNILNMASQLNQENCSLLISSAIFYAFIANLPSMAYFSLRRAYTFKHDMLHRLTIWRGMGELIHFHKEASEEHVVGSYLKDLALRRTSIQHTMKSIWEKMMDERVDTKTMISLTDSFTKQKTEALILWNFVVRSYNENPNVLRQYGIFLEEIEADTDTSQQLFQEASMLETALQKRRLNEQEKQKQGPNSKVKRRSFSNPVAERPRSNSNLNSALKSRARVHPLDSPTPGHRWDQTFDDHFDELDGDADGLESIPDKVNDGIFDVGFDQGVDFDSSRKALFRRSIDSHKPRFATKLLFGGLLTFFVASVLATFIFINHSNNVVQVPQFTIESCRMVDVAVDTVRVFRFVQLSNQMEIVPADDDITQEKLANITSRVMTKAAQRIHLYAAKFNDDLIGLKSWTTPDVPLRYPIINANFTDPDASIFSEVKDTMIYQLKILGENIDIMSTRIRNMYNSIHPTEIFGPFSFNNEVTLTSMPSMTVWLNIYTLSDELLEHCESSIEDYTESVVKNSIISMIAVIVFSVLRIAMFAIVLLVLALILREKKRVLHLLSTRIPKEDISRVYRYIDERLKESSSLAEESSRFAKMSSAKRVDLFSTRNGFWIILTILLLIVFEITFIALSSVTHYMVITTQLDKTSVLHSAALVKQYSAEDDLFMMQYFFDDSHHTFSRTRERYDLSWENTQKLQIQLHKMQDQLASAIAVMKFGGQFLGGGTGSVVGFVKSQARDVRQLMTVGSCPEGSDNSVLDLVDEDQLPPIFTGECLPSTESLLSLLKQKVATSFERYQSLWNKTASTSSFGHLSPALKKDTHEHFLFTGMLLDSVDHMMMSYMNDHSQITVFVTIFEIMFGIGIVAVGILALLSFYLFTQLLKRNQVIRQLLHWIPISTLENVRPLREYVLHHSIQSTSTQRRSIDEDQKTLSILHAAADGIVLLTDQYTIMETNRSACKQLDMIPAELIGIKFLDFVSPSSHKVLESTMKYLFNKRKQIQAIDMEQQNERSIKKIGESDEFEEHHANSIKDDMMAVVREVDMVRTKDGSKFPARLSLNAGLLNGRMVMTIFIRDITQEHKQRELLEMEKKNSEQLLLNVLPEKIAMRLKNGEQNIADRFEDVTCLFSDMVNFTEMGGHLTPGELVEMLNALVIQFDEHTTAFGIEKIKTIGDAFFAVGGLDVGSRQTTENAVKSAATRSHPEQVCRLGIAMLMSVDDYNAHMRPEHIPPVVVRIGIHTGPIIAGVIGTIKYVFDVFGDTVNVASRMESTGVPGKIQVSRQTYQRVFDLFRFKERTINVKGKGEMTTYVLCPEENEIVVKRQVKEDKKDRGEDVVDDDALDLGHEHFNTRDESSEDLL